MIKEAMIEEMELTDGRKVICYPDLQEVTIREVLLAFDISNCKRMTHVTDKARLIAMDVPNWLLRAVARHIDYNGRQYDNNKERLILRVFKFPNELDDESFIRMVYEDTIGYKMRKDREHLLELWNDLNPYRQNTALAAIGVDPKLPSDEQPKNEIKKKNRRIDI